MSTETRCDYSCCKPALKWRHWAVGLAGRACRMFCKVVNASSSCWLALKGLLRLRIFGSAREQKRLPKGGLEPIQHIAKLLNSQRKITWASLSRQLEGTALEWLLTVAQLLNVVSICIAFYQTPSNNDGVCERCMTAMLLFRCSVYYIMNTMDSLCIYTLPVSCVLHSSKASWRHVLLCRCCRDEFYICKGCVQEPWTQKYLIKAAAAPPETHKSICALQFCLNKVSRNK